MVANASHCVGSEVPTPQERRDLLRKQIVDTYGATLPTLERQFDELDSAYVDVMDAYLKTRLRAIGHFLDHHGAGTIWHDLFLRFGLDVTYSAEAWALDDHYKTGDEWRFVYPHDERAVREAMDRARQ